MKNRCLTIIAAVVAFLITHTARADVRLPKIFSDHMVLQQQCHAPVWGWADPGEKITVTLGETKATATADQDGRWKTTIATPPAGGPHTLAVAGNNTITLKDVLIGEVWVASGQSNMEWSLLRSLNPKEEIAAAKYPKIRLFHVQRQTSPTELNDLGAPAAGGKNAWKECSPENVPHFSAVAYFFARKLHKELGVPVGVINTSWGGTVAEAWTSREGLATHKDFEPILERAKRWQKGRPNQASALYNAMIKPLVPYAIAGAIWYQGESNRGRAVQYGKLFPAMIADWRKQWARGDFPFLFVQLAPFHYGNPQGGTLAELWDAQFKTLKNVKNTGMAVTTDIGNVRDIHPKNKQEVGRRLALWALKLEYGKSVVPSGPLYKSHKVEGDKVRISFDHTGGGLVAKDGKPLSHFTIAGTDKNFVPAQAKIDGDSVVVWSDEVKEPIAVRFAWRNDAEPNFFNKEGLPASPFRTDDFELTTAGKN